MIGQYKTSWVVSSAVAKYAPGEKFGTADIAQATGLPTQLVQYHLSIMRPRLAKSRAGRVIRWSVRRVREKAGSR